MERKKRFGQELKEKLAGMNSENIGEVTKYIRESLLDANRLRILAKEICDCFKPEEMEFRLLAEILAGELCLVEALILTEELESPRYPNGIEFADILEECLA